MINQYSVFSVGGTNTSPIVDWQTSLTDVITDPLELQRMLSLPATLLPEAGLACKDFSLRVPRQFISLMTPGDIFDPLLRQVWPAAEELVTTPGFSSDPVGDLQSVKIPGLLSKYPSRVLLIATSACAIHCRYCLRRAFPYPQQQAIGAHWRDTLEFLRSHADITEVILSGGDPLYLTDMHLKELIADLETIPHLRKLRIHTRLPILIPQRITGELLDLLGSTRLVPVVVMHTNHPKELATPLLPAIKRLRAVATLLNQSVLLRGVNADVAVLTTLSERLFECGILPYYLHLLDRVQGAAHFEVAMPEAMSLLTAMRRELPGYLVPRLVCEEPGAAFKTIIL